MSMPSSAAMDSPPDVPAGQSRLLFLVSVLSLFVELMLIRWLGTEFPLLSHLQNTVLVVCFLGLGMGCLTARQPFALRQVLLPLSFLAIVLAIPRVRSALHGMGMMLDACASWTQFQAAVAANPGTTIVQTLMGLAMLLVLLCLVWDIFIPLGRLLGRLMDEHPSVIQAYSANVAGSLVGIWLFVLLSAFYLPPVVWMAVSMVLLLLVARSQASPRPVEVAWAAGLVGLTWLSNYQPGALEVCWSPYQKLTLQVPDDPESGSEAGIAPGDRPWLGIGEYIVRTNNGPYQGMLDLRPESVAKDPERYPPALRGLSQYDIPYLMKPQARKVLIIGAGSGNDVAGALRHGAQEVVAVDIDPAIMDLGSRYHPERPYASPAVRPVCDDARSFFATTPERFDLIVFGLLDAQAGTAMTNTRLDHYVYTRESLAQARRLLADGGVIVLTFEVLRPFMPTRMFDALRDVFGHDPVYFQVPTSHYGWGGVMFVAADDQAAVRRTIDGNTRLAAQVGKWQESQPATLVVPGAVAPATDDWPYIYLEGPQVPFLFLLFTLVLGLLFARGVYRLKAMELFRNWQPGHWHFFFLGAAFLLLEVQNINKAAVVLGNTWSVNVIIISSILTLILLANLLVAYLPSIPLGAVYALLIGSCVGLYFVDLATFAFLPYAGKALVVGGLSSIPILFSGIIFIRSFAAVSGRDTALGANLFGALIGAMLQIFTFLIGIKALLLVVAALYVAALWTRPRPVAEPAKKEGSLQAVS